MNNNDISLVDCSWVTTADNPFDPFTQFTDWNNFDMAKGYNTLSYLMRIAHVDDDMSTVEVEREISRAVNEICYYNLLGIYKRVTAKVPLNVVY